MTDTQKETMLEAIEAENTVLLIELDEAQQNVLSELGIDLEDANKVAANAFASSLRGKVTAAMNKCIKEKYVAQTKGRAQLAEECENEIQKAIKLLRSIS